MSLYYVDEMDFSSGVVDREQWLSSFRFIIVDIVDSEHKFRDVEVMQEITRGISSYVVIAMQGPTRAHRNSAAPILQLPGACALSLFMLRPVLFVHSVQDVLILYLY